MTKEEFFTRYTFNRDTDRLGAGSFGTVFRAYDTVLDRWVALKISPAAGDSMRLSREVELVKGLPEHPNVAGYEDCFTFAESTGDVDVAVLRYYPEGSLADILARGNLSANDAREVLSQILEGVRFLHSHGVIHRYLKPGNILMARRPDGHLVAKITDFGISKTDGSADDTVTTAATVSYASPEQLSGAPVGKEADIWSFGVIAYRVVTGKLPFTSDGLDPNSMQGRARVIEKITSGHLPSGLAALPQPWQRVISGCLVVDPARRRVNESELLAVISSAPAETHAPKVSLSSLSPQVEMPDTDGTLIQPKPAPPAPSEGSAVNGWLVALIVVAVILIGFWVFMLLRGDESAPLVPMETSGDPTENVIPWPEAVTLDEPEPDVVTIDTVCETNYAPADTVAVESVTVAPPPPIHEAETDTVGSASYFD